MANDEAPSAPTAYTFFVMLLAWALFMVGGLQIVFSQFTAFSIVLVGAALVIGVIGYLLYQKDKAARQAYFEKRREETDAS